MTPIWWLASYPKSGNTWFRLLIANLGRAAPVDINDLPAAGGIASARGWFDSIMLFPSGLLTHEECDRLRPRVYRAIAQADDQETDEAMPGADIGETRIGDTRFVKSHDAYTLTTGNEPLLGGAAATAGVILIVRDPRDVASSFASHRNQTIDRTIGFMASPDAAMCGSTDRQHSQLRQQLSGWGGYNASWLEQTDLPLHLVRYEDLQTDAAGTLRTALAFAGIGVTPEEAGRAARFAEFGELRKQEDERGFREAPRSRAGNFFRRGIAGGWRDELTTAQVARIEHDHADMMARLGYGRSAEMKG